MMEMIIMRISIKTGMEAGNAMVRSEEQEAKTELHRGITFGAKKVGSWYFLFRPYLYWHLYERILSLLCTYMAFEICLTGGKQDICTHWIA
jgi:hypothetical protein